MKSDYSRIDRTAAVAHEGDTVHAAGPLAPANAPERERPCGRRRVLIVDRDGSSLAGLSNLLESLGFAVDTACDPEEAVASVRMSAPDAVVVDIGARELEGLNVAHRMREVAGAHALLLIALTGWGQPQYREMALDAGFDVHLVKPVGPDQLAFVLSMTLS